MKPSYLSALDEYFCEQYSDYTKLSAIAGYAMPEVVYVGADGNITRRDSSVMRLSRQKQRDELLEKFKSELFDTTFTFNFRYRTLREKLHDLGNKATFAKLLPKCLARCGETVADAGGKLDIEPEVWKNIVKGKIYPEKNTVIALSLACRLGEAEVNALFTVCGFYFSQESARDVVCEYLIKQKVFNEEIRDRCLAEYKITNLPLRCNSGTDA